MLKQAWLKKIYEKDWLISGIIILIFAIIMFYKIDYFAFWRDEAVSANLTRNSLFDIIFARNQDVHPPLHNVLLKLVSIPFGASELSLRLPSYLFNLTLLIGLYFLSKLNNFKPYQIYTTLLLVASNPQVLYFSSEARAYSMQMALMIWVIYCSQRIWQKFSLKFAVLTFLLSLFLLYSHNLSVLIFAALALWFIPAGIFKIYQNYIVALENIKSQNSNKNLAFSFTDRFKFFLNSVFATKPNAVFPYIITASFIFLAYLPWLFVLIQQILRLQNGGFWDDMTFLGNLQKYYRTGLSSEGFSQFYYLFLRPTGSKIFLIFLAIFSLRYAFKKDLFLIQFYWLLRLMIFLASLKMDILYERYLAFTIPITILFILQVLDNLQMFLPFYKFLKKQLKDVKNYLNKRLGRQESEASKTETENSIFLPNKIFNTFKFPFVLQSFIAIFIFLYTVFISYNQVYAHIDTMKNSQIKPDYKTASSCLTSLQNLFPKAITIHPQALSIHSFKFYNYPNHGFVFDPDRSQPHYFGIAALDDSDYFQGDLDNLLQNDQIIAINIFGVDDFNKIMLENNYQILDISNSSFANLSQDCQVFEEKVNCPEDIKTLCQSESRKIFRFDGASFNSGIEIRVWQKQDIINN
jgi:hypothetical protein